MDAKDAKTYLTGLCLAALLTGGGFAAPGPAFGMGQSGCSTNGVATDTDNGDDNDNDDIDKEPDGNGA
ncbi:SbtA family thio(seleno)oxazole RiPP natural product precursor [Desulfonatronospira sp.]|uniref:SbtA family thio(seleno)oxazole RiPP natural product precursor n=1 Tax=Desulfonatronospira sp. TaxID=1962951 RepID=UPI0025B952BB|nr:SbtA family thio(seleno)oxazole RiPP natural product precursor [Desulfonatronospira sp.]